jgi:hypothetical protein
MHSEQQDAAAVGPSETRLEEMDKRHVNLAQGDGFNLHKCTKKNDLTTEAQRKPNFFLS